MKNITQAQPVIGVIIPLIEEGHYFLDQLTDQNHVQISGISYIIGKIEQKNIVVAISGLGKINSAIIATRLITDFHPSLILLAGSSGSINPQIKKGEVVIAKSVINADFGELTANGTQFQFSEYIKNPQTQTDLPLQFNLDHKFIDLITHLTKRNTPKIILGKIATSDALPNPEVQIKLLQQAGIDVVEMEGAAVMQTCWIFNMGCIVVRGVSNFAKEAFTQDDINFAAENANKIVVEIIKNFMQVSSK